MKKIKKIILFFVLGLIMIIFFVLAVEAVFERQTKGKIYSDYSNVPPAKTLIILGASVHSDGKLSPILKDRMDTAIKLYYNNKAVNFLVTGDHRSDDYNEVSAMVNYLLDNGISEDIIKSDPSGLDTYDSMYRAGAVYNIESAIVVTQRFHLPRALFIAKKLDLDYRGFAADQQAYITENRLKQREKLANVKALYEVLIGNEPSIKD